MLTNIFELVVGANQFLSLSLEVRTAIYVGGNHTFISDPGVYSLATVTIQEHATLSFDASQSMQPAKMSVGRLQVDYGGSIHIHSLELEGNELVLHPGSSIDLIGGGGTVHEGPGDGFVSTA